MIEPKKPVYESILYVIADQLESKELFERTL